MPGEHYITILGPLAVYRRGVPVAVGGPGQRALLGLLTVSAGRSLHRDMIAEVLWPRTPPPAAVAIIQSYVSRLRRVLDPGAEPRARDSVLVSDTVGYRLNLAPDELDLFRFRSFVKTGKQAHQGEPLADLELLRGHPALVAVADECATAVLDYADTAADAGRHELVLPHLRALVARNPLDEASQSRLMIALSGCGKQAEALRVYEELRRRLDRELGVLPGAVLRDAHARVLRQDIPRQASQQDGYGGAAPTPQQLPAPVPLFFGRDAEVAMLDQLRARADDDPLATRALAERCSRLPLALRIAAEHVAAHPGIPVADLMEELTGQRRLDLMDAGGDSGTSVRTVFSWSRGRLDAATDRAFRLIGLHPGPDLDHHAAAALTGTAPAQTDAMLGRLARAHLLQRAGSGRYGMHDLLRAYARELVADIDGEAGERAAMTRLLDFYLHTAAAAMSVMFPAEQHRRPQLPEPGPASAC